MIDQDEEDHQQADEERAFSSITSDKVSEVGSDRNLLDPWLLPEWHFPLYFFVVKGVVEINLLFNLLLHVDQTDLFISLSASFDPHHDVFPGVFGKVMEDRVFREVNELVVDFVSVI